MIIYKIKIIQLSLKAVKKKMTSLPYGLFTNLVKPGSQLLVLSNKPS